MNDARSLFGSSTPTTRTRRLSRQEGAGLVGLGLLLALWTTSPASAQAAAVEEDAAESERTWTSETEASVVANEGNGEALTIGLSQENRWTAGNGRMQFKANAARADSTDDRFRRAVPGLTWQPGETPPPVTSSTLVNPEKEVDVEKYFAELRYDRAYQPHLGKKKRKGSWHVGQSWDRNEDAGILNRYITFAGVGTTWWDREKVFYKSSYGVSYTDREEDEPDPEKEDRFSGIRLGSDFRWQLNETTSLENAWTGNMNLKDANDWSLDMTTRFTVDINRHLKFRFSLQWLYNNEPALEDIDLVANVVVVDPDGIPGNGDEFFETVSEGGFEIDVTEVRERLEALDTVLRSSLVISF